jgi:hypothetical protein
MICACSSDTEGNISLFLRKGFLAAACPPEEGKPDNAIIKVIY